jgi:hypothetical protein
VTSAGNPRFESALRIVRLSVDPGGLATPLEAALQHIPEDLRDEVRDQIMRDKDVVFIRPHVLTEEGGPRAWAAGWDASQGYHWQRLRYYLLDTVGRSAPEIDTLDRSSDAVLRHLEDPRSSGPREFRVQGLVLGYVQSGKTANFSALIAKAADLGYKLVVVLSGIHNSLRAQTQARLNRELGVTVGGVGLPSIGEQWVAVSTAHYNGDFWPGTVDAAVLQGNERVIMVVKKNASVLNRLVNWMDGRVPGDLPVLVIDDEADQASINTGGNRPSLEDFDLLERDRGAEREEDELDPSRINALIRGLLNTFRRVSYVGYTATPFANVLIDPAAIDRVHAHDLYPRDFILSLPRPAGYVGAQELFGRDALTGEEDMVDGLNVVRLVPDCEIGSLIPIGKKAREAWEPAITDSLHGALIDFLLATAGKTHRLGDGISSMLVHTTQRIAQQNALGEEIGRHLATIRQDWRYDRASIRHEFSNRWKDDFRPVTVEMNAANDTEFETIEAYLTEVINDVRVLVLNSSSPDLLDYASDPSVKVVLIGGNRLSRGLTLEQLLVSYYVREAKNYDTLLQMGRWFGYRAAYADLTRLWTTQELYVRFRHLALVEEELRRQIAVYETHRITPLRFGPRIRTHPSMRVTAQNKQGAGQHVVDSYSNQRIQTTRFRLDDTRWLQENLEATRRFFEALGPASPLDPGAPDGRPQWRGVPWQEIERFLSEYQTDSMSFDAASVGNYIHMQAAAHGELTAWTVSIRCPLRPDERLGSVDLHTTGFREIGCIERSRKVDDQWSIGVLTNPPAAKGSLRQGDEEVGLADEQIIRARERYADGEFVTLGDALRDERAVDQGLLLVYPISRFSKKKKESTTRRDLFDDPDKGATVIGLAAAFPFSASEATVGYLQGPAGSAVEVEDDG